MMSSPDTWPETSALKALSIRQPWAWAILYAGKRIENRRWYTPYRGPILIHAGLLIDKDAETFLEPAIRRVPEPRPTAYRGAIVGRAVLADCVRTEEVPANQRQWAFGPWCFMLDDVRPLARPIALKGALGLFSLSPRDELRVAAL